MCVVCRHPDHIYIVPSKNDETEDVSYKLSVAGLAYSTPDGKRQLARDLTFIVEEGMGVVVRGPSGCGKSSLLRCMARACGAPILAPSASRSLLTMPTAAGFCLCRKDLTCPQDLYGSRLSIQMSRLSLADLVMMKSTDYYGSLVLGAR